jgi:hypothetical protein
MKYTWRGKLPDSREKDIGDFRRGDCEETEDGYQIRLPVDAKEMVENSQNNEDTEE